MKSMVFVTMMSFGQGFLTCDHDPNGVCFSKINVNIRMYIVRTTARFSLLAVFNNIYGIVNYFSVKRRFLT